VVENGVSDQRDTYQLQVTDGDPSGVRLTTQDADRFCDEPECPPHATTILLDDLLEVDFVSIADHVTQSAVLLWQLPVPVRLSHALHC